MAAIRRYQRHGTSTFMKPDVVSDEMSAGTLDRRRHPRYRYNAPITIYSADNSAMSGISIEISQSGISALAGDGLTVGEKIKVRGRLPAIEFRQY